MDERGWRVGRVESGHVSPYPACVRRGDPHMIVALAL